MNARMAERALSERELSRIHDGFAAILASEGLTADRERFTFVAEDAAGGWLGAISALSDHRWVYVTDLWVEPDARRRGVGSALLDRLEGAARGRGYASLYAWTESFEGPEFYVARGFERFAVFEGFYGPGRDRIGFVTRLSS